MEVAFILKIVGVGILVSISTSILSKSGRDEQAMLVTVAGIVVVMLLLVGEIGELVSNLRSVFGF
jgi:stage III sporulation protein AC